MMVVFKMRDSVPSARYFSVWNVLRLWNISLIPTYRVYRLYDTLLCWYLQLSVANVAITALIMITIIGQSQRNVTSSVINSNEMTLSLCAKVYCHLNGNVHV